MKTKEDFSNRDRFVELGVVIAALRKKAGMDIYAKVKYNRPDDVVVAMAGAFAQWES